MIKDIKSIKEMIDEILHEVEGQENYREIAMIVRTLDIYVIIDGANLSQDCYDMLDYIGEQKLVDKYIKPLI